MTLAGDIIRGKALDLLVERADIEPASATDARRDRYDPTRPTTTEETP